MESGYYSIRMKISHLFSIFDSQISDIPTGELQLVSAFNNGDSAKYENDMGYGLFYWQFPVIVHRQVKSYYR